MFAAFDVKAGVFWGREQQPVAWNRVHKPLPFLLFISFLMPRSWLSQLPLFLDRFTNITLKSTPLKASVWPRKWSVIMHFFWPLRVILQLYQTFFHWSPSPVHEGLGLYHLSFRAPNDRLQMESYRAFSLFQRYLNCPFKWLHNVYYIFANLVIQKYPACETNFPNRSSGYGRVGEGKGGVENWLIDFFFYWHFEY